MSKQTMLDELEAAVAKLLTLEIKTSVGTPAADATGGQPVPAAKVILSRINLAEGDITTEVDPAFITGEYKDLMAFHMKREAQAQEIVASNVKILRDLFTVVKDHFKE